MALIILGSTRCVICREVLVEGDETVGFPAFLPASHALFELSDGAMHRRCLNGDDRRDELESLFRRYQEIWASKPAGLSFDESEAWGTKAFAEFP